MNQPLQHIGILGSGQLGMMLCEAAQSIKLKATCVDGNERPPASYVSAHKKIPLENIDQLIEFAKTASVLTYEFENIPFSTIEQLDKIQNVHPSLKALSVASDRLLEKQMFKKLGIPTNNFKPISSLEELQIYLNTSKAHSILKTRKLGYDGKGQFKITSDNQAKEAFDALNNTECILEECVDFDYEVSLVAAKSLNGEFKTYPLTTNSHENGILKTSIPSHQENELLLKATDYIKKIMQHLEYAGILSVEFFVQDGSLIAGEIAPRVHNSGHWTLDGAVTSQFENHLRAVSGMPLGDTCLKSPSAMINVIGNHPDIEEIKKIDGTKYYDYHKTERPLRKLAHINITADNDSDLRGKIQRVQNILDKN